MTMTTKLYMCNNYNIFINRNFQSITTQISRF